MNQNPKPQSEMRPVQKVRFSDNTIVNVMSTGMHVRMHPKIKGKANVKAHRKERREARMPL